MEVLQLLKDDLNFRVKQSESPVGRRREDEGRLEKKLLYSRMKNDIKATLMILSSYHLKYGDLPFFKLIFIIYRESAVCQALF